METQTTLHDLIVKELELEGVSPDVQETILFALTEATIKKAMMEVADKLSEEDRKVMDKIIEKENATPDELLVFLNSKIPNLDEIVTDQAKYIIADFKSRRE
jgi:predicted ATPase with chaperone activity